MKQWRVLISLLAGAVSSLSCGPSLDLDAAAPVEARSDEIVGGTLWSGDPAVVSLAIRYGGTYQSLCTGTLVGPKTVVTAAHCIYSYGANAPYYVVFGPDSSRPVKAVQVAQQYEHPSYNQSAFDFGLLRLAQPVIDVTPVPMNDQAMSSSLVGQPIRHVGYGLTQANTNGDGLKRQVSYNLRRVFPYTIESGGTGKQTCQGDSGGPAFMVMPGRSTESLVGVVSYGAADCLSDGYDGRVDIGLNWIRTTMAQWETPTCQTDGQCVQGCTPIDQDCACAANGICGSECIDAAYDPDCPKDCGQNGVCATQTCGRADPDCVPEGGYCSAAAQCKERLCVTDQQNPLAYCTRLCSAPADCPDGMECASGSCRMKQKPVRQFLETCYASSEYCAEGVCAGPAGGIARCVKPCLVTADCASGSVCEASGNSQRFCRPSDVSFNSVTLAANPIVSGPAASGCSTLGSAWLLGALAPLLRRRRARRA